MLDSSSFLLLLANLPNTKRFWLAYSGGVDSHVLLHALANLPEKLPLSAVYVNHGWHPQASLWGEHCVKTCDELGINCKIIAVDAKPQAGQSPEAVARAARYAALAELMAPGDCLLTAHHQDDQAETLLLQLFRGAGIKGLAAMPTLTSFAQGYHLRPLLPVSRAELLAYAQHHQLVWIEDESNANLRFDRNFIRQQLLPTIQQRWPAVASTLARTASHCAEAAELLDIIAIEDLENITGSHSNTLSITKLLSLNVAQRHNVIRYWLRKLHFPIPNEKQLRHIEQDILTSRIDAYPKVKFAKIEIRRYQDNLYALPIFAKKILPQNMVWDLSQPLEIPSVGILTARPVSGTGIRQSAIPDNQVNIRFRQGGERLHPVGRQGSHPLKKLMQEWHVSPWERDRIPLIFSNDQLIAVTGYCVDEKFSAPADEAGWQIFLSI